MLVSHKYMSVSVRVGLYRRDKCKLVTNICQDPEEWSFIGRMGTGLLQITVKISESWLKECE